MPVLGSQLRTPFLPMHSAAVSPKCLILLKTCRSATRSMRTSPNREPPSLAIHLRLDHCVAAFTSPPFGLCRKEKEGPVVGHPLGFFLRHAAQPADSRKPSKKAA